MLKLYAPDLPPLISNVKPASRDEIAVSAEEIASAVWRAHQPDSPGASRRQLLQLAPYAALHAFRHRDLAARRRALGTHHP